MSSNHPYYPLSAPIVGFRPNQTPLWILAGYFVAIIGAVLVVAVWLAEQTRRRKAVGRLRWGDALKICWFGLCGFLHCFFEAYFVLSHDSIASSQSLFAQLWKEYALSDSRYMSKDLFLVTIEALTALILGPLSITAAVCIARSSKSQYLAQAVVSSMHLYSVALYYGICFVSESFLGISYSRPEFLYYWVYFIGFNAPWVIVPSLLLYQSSYAIKGVSDLKKKA